MPADITWSLSGVDARRWRIQAASMWRPPVSVRASNLEVPGRHGHIAAGLPVFDAPTVSLVMQPLGDQVELEEAQAELVGLLSAPGLVLGRSSGGSVTSADARLVSLSPAGFTAERYARFEVLLSVPGVFMRGAVAAPPAVLLTATGQVVVMNAALNASTGPIADAVVRVQGPLTSVTVTDDVTGTSLSWGGSLTDSQYLYLDAGRMTARRAAGASAWETGGTDVSSDLDYRPAGPLQMWSRMVAADPSVSAITLTVTGGGWGAATALAVRARPAYL